MKYFEEISVFILASVLVVSSGLSKLQNISSTDYYSGNCSNASYETRVYQDHIIKTGWPLIVRSETVNYRGDRKIFCIELSNLLGNETGTANITDGGVGHNYVDIDIESFRGYGLDWNVTIYGDKTKMDSGSPGVLLQSVLKNIV